MAYAEPIYAEAPLEEVILTLSAEEAQALRNLVGAVAWGLAPAYNCQTIFEALVDAGLNRTTPWKEHFVFHPGPS